MYYHILNEGVSCIPILLLYFSRVYATVLSSSFSSKMQIMQPQTPTAVAKRKKFRIDSLDIYNTIWRRWYSSSFSLCFFIADSDIGIIGVFLNYSTGLNSMKFRGSSAQIDPGIDKFTKNSLRTRQRQGESTVSKGKNSIFCGSIFVSGLVEPQSSSQRQKVDMALQQSLKELSTVILRACIMFWFGVSKSYTKSGSMQGGKCSFLTGTKLQKSFLFYICCSFSFFFYNWVGSLPRMLSISARESSSVYLSILTVSAKLKYNLLLILGRKQVRSAFLLNFLIIIIKNLYLIVTYVYTP